VSTLFHGKRHLVSHTQRGVSHTLQRIDALIKTLELQIFRVGIAGPDTRENGLDPSRMRTLENRYLLRGVSYAS